MSTVAPAAGTFFLGSGGSATTARAAAVVLPPVLGEAVEVAGAAGAPAVDAPVAADGWFGVWGGMTTGVPPAEGFAPLGAAVLVGEAGGRGWGGRVGAVVEVPPAELGNGGGVADPPPPGEGAGEVEG